MLATSCGMLASSSPEKKADGRGEAVGDADDQDDQDDSDDEEAADDADAERVLRHEATEAEEDEDDEDDEVLCVGAKLKKYCNWSMKPPSARPWRTTARLCM